MTVDKAVSMSTDGNFGRSIMCRKSIVLSTKKVVQYVQPVINLLAQRMVLYRVSVLVSAVGIYLALNSRYTQGSLDE